MLDADSLTYVHRIWDVPREVDSGGQAQPWEDFVSGLAEYGLAIDATSRMHLQGVNRFRYFNSAVRAVRTTAQSINDSTLTVVAFNATDDFDTDTLHDTATNNSRLTAAIAGKYFVYCFIDWAVNSTGDRVTRIEKNSDGTPTSANVIAGVSSPGSAAVLVNQNVSCITSLAAGDRVEVIVFQTSGGSLNVDGATQPLAFGMAYLGE